VCVVTADPTACMVGSANSNTTVQYNDTGWLIHREFAVNAALA
jgi:hypothetical protein